MTFGLAAALLKGATKRIAMEKSMRNGESVRDAAVKRSYERDQRAS
jgi:hypothetical protein